MESKPLPDQAAHRQAAERKLIDAENGRQIQHVSAKLLDLVVARRNLGAAVAARIVAQHAKLTD
jgi:hypothetical protein